MEQTKIHLYVIALNLSVWTHNSLSTRCITVMSRGGNYGDVVEH